MIGRRLFDEAVGVVAAVVGVGGTVELLGAAVALVATGVGETTVGGEADGSLTLLAATTVGCVVAGAVMATDDAAGVVASGGVWLKKLCELESPAGTGVVWLTLAPLIGAACCKGPL
jgi:hypothetical protein